MSSEIIKAKQNNNNNDINIVHMHCSQEFIVHEELNSYTIDVIIDVIVFDELNGVEKWY